MNTKEEMVRRKALNMRYRKSCLQGLNYTEIVNDLYDMGEACGDIHYYDDDEALLNALDGDEDEAFEFRMGFSDLDANVQRLLERAEETDVSEYFDDFFVGILSEDNDMESRQIFGWDAYEQDYFALLGSFERNLAEGESKKRLMRMTKEELLRVAGECLTFEMLYQAVKFRFDGLKAAYDIVAERNASLIRNAKEIEEAYDKWALNGYEEEQEKELDALTCDLPARAWIE